MTPRILVTGGSGLLGSYLLRWFKKKGYDKLTATYQSTSAAIPTDLKDGIEWRRSSLPDKPDAFELMSDKDWVIHSAGLISYFKEDKYKLLEVNKEGTGHIVNACLAHQVEHLIYIGSIGSLGKESNNVVLNESNGWLQNQYSTSYGLSKYFGELEAWRGASEGLNVSVILPSVILGTGNWQRSSLKLIDLVANGSPFYPGGQTGYVDVRDVAEFAGILLERSLSGDRWILNGANLTYGELYQRIADQLNIKKKFQEAPEWQARIMLLASNLKSGRFSVPDILNQVYGTFYYDASKSQTVEGFKYTPIDQTIREVALAFKEGIGAKPLPIK